MLKHFSIVLILCSLTFSVSATHLLGGTISYKHIFSSAGKVNNLITIEVYRDCNNGRPSFESTISIGIYKNDKNKSLYKTVAVELLNTKTLDVPCSFTFTNCAESGIYKSLISLDTSSTGYYVVYSRCCRAFHQNLVDENLRQINGFTFFTFIGPTKNKNNSPQFNSNPSLLYGVTVPNEDDWGATDIDKDSLVYEMVAPYTGGDQNNPIPDYSNTLFNPLSVKYNSGFSFTYPFGNNGSITIDRYTGKLNFSNAITVTFAFSMEIKEYRRGILIGRHRRDYPLIFINLPPNPLNYTIKLSKPIYYSLGFVKLVWEVCPEDLAEYTIERKQDTAQWIEITTLQKTKSHFDSIHSNKLYYYRIKAKLNGKEGVSNIDSALFIFEKGSVKTKYILQSSIYPNPAKDYIILKNQSILSYSIYETTGKIILVSEQLTNKFNNRIEVGLLNSGIYLIVLKTEKGIISERFVKE